MVNRLSDTFPSPPRPDERVLQGAHSFFWKAARLGLLAVLVSAPLAFGAVEYWARAALLVAALALMLLWSFAVARDKILSIYWTPLYLVGAIFLLLGITQFSGHLTIDAFATREALLGFVTPLVYFFLAGQMMAQTGGRNLSRFALIVLIYASALSLFAIIQLFSGSGLIYWTVKPRWGGSVMGPYVNRNDYAGLMEMLVPLGVAYVLSRPKGYPAKTLLGFAALLSLTSLLLSGSRGGLVSLLVEAVVLVGVVVKSVPGVHRRHLVATIGIGIIAVDLLFFWLAPTYITRHLKSTVAVVSSPEVSMGDRLKVSEDALRIFLDHPWLGTGLGTFEEAFPQYQSFPSDLEWDHAHNDFAEALSETGLAGGILIAIALFLGLRTAFGSLSSRLTTEEGWIQLGATIGCCGLLVHSFVDFNLHIPANALWFSVALAIATFRREPQKLPSPIPST